MSERDDIRLFTRELNRDENKKKAIKTTHIIRTSIKRQFFVFLSVLLIIIIGVSLINAINLSTVNKVSSISKTISSTGKIGNKNFLRKNEDKGYYEIDKDKAYEELEGWAKKSGINLNSMGITKEIYGEMLKMEAEQSLVSLGGTPSGDNAIQGKIILYRKKSDGTRVPMKFLKKEEWNQLIINKKTNEITGLGIGATKAQESDDMTTDDSKKIWMALKTNGWSNMAIIGAMGNMYVESKYSSEKSEGKSNNESSEYTTKVNNEEIEKSDFINDEKGYGLIQWKSKEDKEAIYNLAKENQVSIGDFAMQLKIMQSQAENNERMKLFIEGKDSEGRKITETSYAVTAFYEYWIKKNYEFKEKSTSDTERTKDNLATRWKAGEEVQEEYVYNQKLGLNLITGTQKIASTNKFVGLNNNQNRIKIADEIIKSEDSGSLTATSKEDAQDLDKLWDETQSSFTLDENNNIVVGSVYTSEIQIEPSDFAEEESQVNKIVTEDGSSIQLDNGETKENDSNLCYQMQLKQQTIKIEDLPSNANLSTATITSILATTSGNKTATELKDKFQELIQGARDQQGKEVDIEDFTTVVVTTKTEKMNLKFDIRKTVEFHPDDSVEENETKTSEFKDKQEEAFTDERPYRKITTTEITKIPQAVIAKQKTIGKEITYHYEENTSEDIEQPEDVVVGDDEEYTGWVVCNKGGEGEKQNSKVQADYHNYLEGLKSDVGGTVIDTHEHLVQTASNRSIKTQIDTTRSIYIKIGESVITNNANALINYLKETDLEEGMLREYLKAAGVKEEEIDEVLEALKKAKEKNKNKEGGSDSKTSGYPTMNTDNNIPQNDPNPKDDKDDKDDKKGKDDTKKDDDKVKVEDTFKNKLAKAAYNQIKKGVKFVEGGKDLNTGVDNPQFVYQLLKTETQMYTGEYVKLKKWKTELAEYIVGNNINEAEEGDVIIYKNANEDKGYRICIYTGKDNIIMEVDETGGTTKKLDLNKYTIDRIFRFNEDGSKPEIDPSVIRLIMIEPSSLKLEQKENVQLKATILPESAAEDAKVKWKSDNEKIATVNQDGEVTVKGYGDVTITATTSNGKTAKSEIQIGKDLQTKYTTDTKEDLSGVVDNTKKGQRKKIGAYVGNNQQAYVDGGTAKQYKDIDSLAKKFMDEYGVNITCSEKVHPRYYIGYTKMNISKNNKDLKSLDGQEKIDIPKNTKIVVTKKEQIGANSTGPYYKNSPRYMNIQFKDKDGNVRKFQLNYSYRYLFLNGWINMLGQRWSVEQAEEFVNKTAKADSQTNYCLWINPYNKISFLFKGSKGNWKAIRIMDAANGTWQWVPSSPSSADTTYSLSSARDKKGQLKINSKNGVVWEGLYYVMDYAGGNCIHSGSPLEYNTTHGCIAFHSADAKYLYENVPVGTKVILY